MNGSCVKVSSCQWSRAANGTTQPGLIGSVAPGLQHGVSRDMAGPGGCEWDKLDVAKPELENSTLYPLH